MARPETGLAFARESFGHLALGDRRRTKAAITLLAHLVRKPAGKISQAFRSSAMRERAYRFVRNRGVQALALTVALARSVAARIQEASMVYVVVDGSSLTLTDPRGRKDFGRVGTNRQKGRGLKVITALVVELSGAPLGILWQKYWTRPERVRARTKSADNRARKTHEKETQHWLDVINQAAAHSDPSKLWFLVDREGDSREVLRTLEATGARYTVRANWNRALVRDPKGRKRYLRGVMRRAPEQERFVLDVPAGPKRKARKALMTRRARRLTVVLRDRWVKSPPVELEVNVVWAREAGTTPSGEEPLDWMLLTNAPIDSPEDVLAVLRSYKARWRIEDLHKTWKSGGGHVEDMQLHTVHAATIFAVMHAAVAARAERLKHVSRTSPDQSASVELTKDERKAIQILAYDMLNEELAPGGRRQTKLTVPDPETMSIGEAVAWLARLGGYTGKSSGGPPGAITIGRGLEEVLAVARALPALRRLTGR